MKSFRNNHWANPVSDQFSRISCFIILDSIKCPCNKRVGTDVSWYLVQWLPVRTFLLLQDSCRWPALSSPPSSSTRPHPTWCTVPPLSNVRSSLLNRWHWKILIITSSEMDYRIHSNTNIFSLFLSKTCRQIKTHSQRRKNRWEKSYQCQEALRSQVFGLQKTWSFFIIIYIFKK